MNDCLLCIFNYLPLTDVVKCSTISKQYNTVSNNNLYWSKVYKSEFVYDLKHCDAQTKCKQYYILNKWILNKAKYFMYDLPITTSLHLNDFRLKSVPSEIGHLTKLKKLYLCNNKLGSIPTTIGSLTNLEHLLLSKNKLFALPSNIGLLTNLKELSLFDNNLNSLPKTIKKLTGLQDLSLSHNLLETKSFSKGIEKLTGLKVLSLSNNLLQSFPQEINSLTNLNSLMIDQSQKHFVSEILEYAIFIVPHQTTFDIEIGKID